MVFGPPREHPPAHVHVYKGQESAVVIRLGIGAFPPTIWEGYDMHSRDVAVAYRLVEAHQRLLNAWEQIHG